MFDEIVIAIGINAKKNYMFSVEERMKFIGNTFFAEEKISVETYKGLTVNYCKEINANFILRGLRTLQISNLKNQLRKPTENYLELKPYSY